MLQPAATAGNTEELHHQYWISFWIRICIWIQFVIKSHNFPFVPSSLRIKWRHSVEVDRISRYQCSFEAVYVWLKFCGCQKQFFVFLRFFSFFTECIRNLIGMTTLVRINVQTFNSSNESDSFILYHFVSFFCLLQLRTEDIGLLLFSSQLYSRSSWSVDGYTQQKKKTKLRVTSCFPCCIMSYNEMSVYARGDCFSYLKLKLSTSPSNAQWFRFFRLRNFDIFTFVFIKLSHCAEFLMFNKIAISSTKSKEMFHFHFFLFFSGPIFSSSKNAKQEITWGLWK